MTRHCDSQPDNTAGGHHLRCTSIPKRLTQYEAVRRSQPYRGIRFISIQVGSAQNNRVLKRSGSSVAKLPHFITLAIPIPGRRNNAQEKRSKEGGEMARNASKRTADRSLPREVQPRERHGRGYRKKGESFAPRVALLADQRGGG